MLTREQLNEIMESPNVVVVDHNSWEELLAARGGEKADQALDLTTVIGGTPDC